MIDMTFNMGAWFDKKEWAPTAKLLGEGKWSEAANHLRNSAWARQVKGRSAEVLALLTQTGDTVGPPVHAAGSAVGGGAGGQVSAARQGGPPGGRAERDAARTADRRDARQATKDFFTPAPEKKKEATPVLDMTFKPVITGKGAHPMARPGTPQVDPVDTAAALIPQGMPRIPVPGRGPLSMRQAVRPSIQPSRQEPNFLGTGQIPSPNADLGVLSYLLYFDAAAA